MSVEARPQTPSPAPVGTSITWNAIVADPAPGTIWYKFRTRSPIDSRFQTTRDFHSNPSWEWVPAQFDGRYEIEVTARNRDTGDLAVATVAYDVTSLVTGDMPVITPSRNELVFLYSAPACPPDRRIIVEFTAADGFRQSTNSMNCRAGTSINVYLAGLRAETAYTVQQSVIDATGVATQGPALTLTTGPLSFTPAATRAIIQPQVPGIVLQNRVFEQSIATDTSGNVVWYYPTRIPYLTHPEAGGFFFALFENHNAGPEEQYMRQIDLAGNTVLETNAGRINEQLKALGMQAMTSFHHEARRMPDGNILVLAGNERILRDIQGPGDIDVIGDMILVLDPYDFRVVWAWDAFDRLDVFRMALLDEKCVKGGGGCPTFYLADVANDWLHGNSLALTPEGDIIYSARHQDWVIRINYAWGLGAGDVMWRLGKGGDFRLVDADETSWFSHQHYASIIDAGVTNSLLVFDNGNMRRTNDDSAHSRGQLFELDQTTYTARLSLNSDLGDYALALGSAERLPSGNYHFGLGWMPNAKAQMLEYSPSGTLVSRLEADTQVYRALRMPNLYTPLETNWIANSPGVSWTRP